MEKKWRDIEEGGKLRETGGRERECVKGLWRAGGRRRANEMKCFYIILL